MGSDRYFRGGPEFDAQVEESGRLRAELSVCKQALEKQRLTIVGMEEDAKRLRAVANVVKSAQSSEAEIEFAARIAAQETVEALRTQANTFTEEDIKLIREHVRLPPVVQAAVLAERCRCAQWCGLNGSAPTVLLQNILSGETLGPKP